MSDRRKSKSGLHLSADTLKSLINAPLSVQVIWDTSLAGFGLRTRANANPQSWRWVYTYRHRTRSTQVTLTLGSPLMYTAEEARRWAKDAAKKANTSDDIFDAKESQRAAHATERARPTVKQLWDEWYEAEGQSKKSAKDDRQRWSTHLEPMFGKMKVAAVTPRDVNRIKTELTDKPITANRCISLLSTMMTFAVAHQYRGGCSPEHPIKAGVVKRNKENPVDFYFSTEQLGRILAAADAEPNIAAGLAIRMLALTGARLGEVTNAHWGQFTERSDGRLIWTVERTNTKTGEPCQRTLDPDLSRRLLEWKPLSLADQKVTAISAEKPRLVFPSARSKKPDRQPIHIPAAWRRIKKAAGLKVGRIHDLRHSCATAIVRETGSLEAAKRQLGHTTILTTQRYAHHVTEMADRTSEFLARNAEAAMAKARENEEGAEVVQLRTGGTR